MSVESTIRNAAYKLQKTSVSIAEKVSDLVPKLGPGVGPRRDLIRLVGRLQKAVNREFDALRRRIAGSNAALKKLIRK